MEYCGPIGLPYSAFLGWDVNDQDAALAWKRNKAEVCANCGTLDADWRDAKTKQLLDPAPFEVEGHRCAGCVEIANYREREDVQSNTVGLYLRLRPAERQ